MAYREILLGECLPKTREGIEALAKDWRKRTQNFEMCGSPIEHDFLHCFYKVKSEDVVVEGQVPCQTRLGRFRLDFLITSGRRRIGVECDGKEFHKKQQDRRRDEAILRTGFVDVIYRVPGRSLWFYTYEVLDLLRLQEPSLFSYRGNQLLDAILDDGTEREDSSGPAYILRTLRRQQSKEEEEEGEADFKGPSLVSLGWSHRASQS
jgi:very-short-patch-repair endonuclease